MIAFRMIFEFIINGRKGERLKNQPERWMNKKSIREWNFVTKFVCTRIEFHVEIFYTSKLISTVKNSWTLNFFTDKIHFQFSLFCFRKLRTRVHLCWIICSKHIEKNIILKITTKDSFGTQLWLKIVLDNFKSIYEKKFEKYKKIDNWLRKRYVVLLVPFWLLTASWYSAHTWWLPLLPEVLKFGCGKKIVLEFSVDFFNVVEVLKITDKPDLKFWKMFS